jgi:hypothetical protein
VQEKNAEVAMEEGPLNNVWVGVDVGKEFHWAHVLDTVGRMLLSRRVENDEADLLALIEEILSFGAGDLTWAVDQPGGGASLLLALLWERGQKVIYVPGLTVETGRVTPTVASQRPMPATLMSLPIRSA